MATYRKTRSITASTAVVSVPRDALDLERRAREDLSDLDDDAIVEVRIDAPTETKALFPVGLLRRYLEAQEVDGRELLVFDSDEEVSSEVAASMLGFLLRVMFGGAPIYALVLGGVSFVLAGLLVLRVPQPAPGVT